MEERWRGLLALRIDEAHQFMSLLNKDSDSWGSCKFNRNSWDVLKDVRSHLRNERFKSCLLDQMMLVIEHIKPS